MRVFIYQAALLCESCGCAARANLDAAFKENGATPVNADDESSYDSDRYPKGPYRDGGGEADTPQCCDHCGVFLENPLTSDGDKYVRELAEPYTKPDASWHEVAMAASGAGKQVLADWIDFYYSPGL